MTAVPVEEPGAPGASDAPAAPPPLGPPRDGDAGSAAVSRSELSADIRSESPVVEAPPAPEPSGSSRAMPRWVPRAIVLFWLGAAALLVGRVLVDRLDTLLVMVLISLFLSFAIEPGVNRLAKRGWRRGTATGVVMLAVLLFTLGILGAIGTLVGQQVADLLDNSERYVNRTVDFINDTFNTEIDPAEVNETITDPEGPIYEFIQSQSDEALRLSARVVGVLLQILSIGLFTFYLVADGPRLRRAICSRMSPERQQRVLEGWNLAIEKTGGYLFSRAILAVLSGLFHYVAFVILDVPYAAALAVWVGIVSQFLPVVGTYLAGVLPVLLTLIDNPARAIWVLGVIVLYQQVENYFFQPRVAARTMELHPAVAFGAALAGAALLGPVGAVLALPAAATVWAFVSQYGARHEVVENELTVHPRRFRRRRA